MSIENAQQIEKLGTIMQGARTELPEFSEDDAIVFLLGLFDEYGDATVMSFMYMFPEEYQQIALSLYEQGEG